MAPAAMAALVLVSSAGASACAKAKTGSGAGQKASICTIFKLYDNLAEPSPEDPAAVRRYAQTVERLYDRVDRHVKVNGHVLPKAIVADAKQIKASMRTFDDDYGKASTHAQRVAAEAKLVADRKLDRSINAITAFTKDQCVKKSNVPIITTPTTRKN